jgi:hypothetical protein
MVRQPVAEEKKEDCSAWIRPTRKRPDQAARIHEDRFFTALLLNRIPCRTCFLPEKLPLLIVEPGIITSAGEHRARG